MDRPILVDSNVFIYLLRAGRDPAIALGNRYAMVDLATCPMVRLEVLRGQRSPKVIERLEEFFDVLMNVPADPRLWREATDLARDLERAGFTIPSQDALIAASALRIGAAVFTFDRHFEQIPGIPLIREAL